MTPILVRRLFAILGACAVLALAAPAHADADLMKRKRCGTVVSGSSSNYRTLNGVAANAAAGSRTFECAVGGYSKLSLWVDVVEVGAITAIVVTCSASPNGGTTYAQLTSTSVSGGTGTVVAYSDSYATTASATVLFEYDVRTYDYFKCTVDVTGGGASDTITAYATAAVGQ
jgi:hypothetical protein